MCACAWTGASSAARRFASADDDDVAHGHRKKPSALPHLDADDGRDSPLRSEVVSGAGASDAVVLSVTMGGGRKKSKAPVPHSLSGK